MNAQPSDRVFKSAPTLRTFKSDLFRAGIADKLEDGRISTADKNGRTLDRHAMRTTFVTRLGHYGVDYRAQVVPARHSPQGITLRNYQDFSVFDLWSEIRKLPGLEPEPQQAGKATGSLGGAGVGPPVGPMVGVSTQSPAPSGNGDRIRTVAHSNVSRCAVRATHRLSSAGILGATGFEPATSCSQSRRATGLRHAPLAIEPVRQPRQYRR